MKHLGDKIAFLANRAAKIPGNALSYIVRCFTPLKAGRVMLWAYNFKQYGCNPRYVAEYLVEHYPDMEIYWVVRNGVKSDNIDKRIKVVRFRSWEYLKLVASAEFLVTNSRTAPYRIYWHKRPEQKYLMLWHGGVSLKRIERDAEEAIGYSYTERAKLDSKVCDLMISGCKLHTELIHRSFWYSGEVLECGIPRNDIFFHAERKAEFRSRVERTYSISPDSRIVLYAPTFRKSMTIEPYRIDWSRVIPALRKMLSTDKLTVIVRMHPNLIGKVDTSSLIGYEGVVDGTRYHDMQELLTVADMLITDYSSSMFDFAMQRRACLLYATDVAEYDRGYYFNLGELPFPLCQSEDALLNTIENFDNETYLAKLDEFYATRIGLLEEGHATESVAKWINDHRVR